MQFTQKQFRSLAVALFTSTSAALLSGCAGMTTPDSHYKLQDTKTANIVDGNDTNNVIIKKFTLGGEMFGAPVRSVSYETNFAAQVSTTGKGTNSVPSTNYVAVVTPHSVIDVDHAIRARKNSSVNADSFLQVGKGIGDIGKGFGYAAFGFGFLDHGLSTTAETVNTASGNGQIISGTVNKSNVNGPYASQIGANTAPNSPQQIVPGENNNVSGASFNGPTP